MKRKQWFIFALILEGFTVAFSASKTPPIPAKEYKEVKTYKTCGILKLEYKNPGDAPTGGIAGAAFFVDANKAVTASHVVKKCLWMPEDGYKYSFV